MALVLGADVDDERVRVIDELADDLIRGDLVHLLGDNHGRWQHRTGGRHGCGGRRAEPEEQERWHEEGIHGMRKMPLSGRLAKKTESQTLLTLAISGSNRVLK